mmetsp:Transcript_46712/g.99754  ORF Transcript_46712/g.99754 Transcript_46712/m.99754 type:complete len:710 (+) Transcript_46712:85-2214(+)
MSVATDSAMSPKAVAVVVASAAKDKARAVTACKGAAAVPCCCGALGAELGRLRRLTQPYFLPLEETSSWLFAWLLLSLLFVVFGLSLLFLTGVMGLISQLVPDLAEEFMGGANSSLQSRVWGSGWGIGILVAFGVGVASFAASSHHLRSRRWLPWLLLGTIVMMLLLINALNAGIGFIARDLTNSLIAKHQQEYYHMLLIYATCFMVALPLRTMQSYVTAKLGLLWREWLSLSLIRDYMGNRTYYVLNPNDEEATSVDNPDQRITEDTRAFTRQSLDFTVGIFDALLTFCLNIIVLWTISRTLTLALAIWSLTCTVILVLASRNLVRINFQQLRYEADFRYGLVHIRNNAESIAFYAGELPEKKETHRRLDVVVQNFNRLIKWEVILNVLRRSYTYAGNFFPYLIMAPSFLAGQQGYGSFVQANFAFNQVEFALSFIVSNIDDLAKWFSGISRLEGFQQSVQEANKETREMSRDLSLVSDGNAGCILVRGADLRTPNGGRLLVRDLNLSVSNGERLLVVGPSGCGKTSVLRMISGLWEPSGTGIVERPAASELLFIPQKPYMLLGSLREQLCYPLPEGSFDDEALRAALREVSLASLAERYPDLGAKQDWPQLLSLGEQQRLAFARLFLSTARYAVLDEATSALDVATERKLYGLLGQRGIAIISVGHRPGLIEFHQQVLELQGHGAWRLLPAANYSFGCSSPMEEVCV